MKRNDYFYSVDPEVPSEEGRSPLFCSREKERAGRTNEYDELFDHDERRRGHRWGSYLNRSGARRGFRSARNVAHLSFSRIEGRDWPSSDSISFLRIFKISSTTAKEV
ncbi:hypothetical protein PUN28_002659 [Cardiocondyla obscurior]|uniref:Uncharacterized protein n=1 Tax=Cardiocondyla obscurior TaxID=286306 RepID=A0AAW2GVI3_9HYME